MIPARLSLESLASALYAEVQGYAFAIGPHKIPGSMTIPWTGRGVQGFRPNIKKSLCTIHLHSITRTFKENFRSSAIILLIILLKQTKNFTAKSLGVKVIFQKLLYFVAKVQHFGYSAKTFCAQVANAWDSSIVLVSTDATIVQLRYEQ